MEVIIHFTCICKNFEANFLDWSHSKFYDNILTKVNALLLQCPWLTTDSIIFVTYK